MKKMGGSNYSTNRTERYASDRKAFSGSTYRHPHSKWFSMQLSDRKRVSADNTAMSNISREEIDLKLELNLTKSDAKLALLHSELVASEGRMAQQVGTIGSQVGSVQGQIGELKGEISTKVGAIQGQIGELKGEIASLVQTVNTLTQTVSTLANTQQTTVASIQQDNKSLKHSIWVTAIATVLAIAAFNSTVLSNMVASFESGRNIAQALASSAASIKEAQDAQSSSPTTANAKK